MLFERLQREDVGNFVGWLNPFSAGHRRMLLDCDLLITVEDRNIYRRVAGDLPPCRKLAINTDPAKVLKNEYLDNDDVLVEGDPAEVLTALCEAMEAAGAGRPATPWALDELRADSRINPDPPSEPVHDARRRIAAAIGDVLTAAAAPVLIDDSSMFGGLLNEHYDDLPSRLRVFGGHGGFVGAGLSYAVGLALAEPTRRVVCTLGDQAFTNSFQSLVAAVREQAPLLIVVCNNGEAVSLKKQATASHGASARHYLDNVSSFDYCEVANAMGVPAERVAVPIGGLPADVAAGVASLRDALDRGVRTAGPSLVELVLPSDPRAWQGIWIVQGFEQTAGASVG
jgi:acetolactate synthase-1/2/3 large subunit